MKVLCAITASIIVAALAVLAGAVGGAIAEAVLPGKEGEAAAEAILIFAILIAALAISITVLEITMKKWCGVSLFPGLLGEDP